MLSYILKRLATLIPTWITVAFIAFIIINMAPGDPAAILAGTDAADSMEAIRAQLGLDKPAVERFLIWIGNVFRGDFGDSYFMGQSVKDAIIQRLPVTFSLALVSLIMAAAIGVPLGLIASLKPNSLRDTSIMGVSLIGLSTPEFFLGFILIYLFALVFPIFEVGGYVPMAEGFFEWLRHLILPSFSLGFIWASFIARVTRSSMLEALNQDYVMTARAKGQREFVVITKHAFRNAVLPLITALGMVFALLLTGAFITEVLFRIPGAGNLIVNAIKRRDYPVVQGALLVFSTAVLLVNLIVDILYSIVDPRVKYGK